MLVVLLPIEKSEIYARWRANWIRPAITAYCSITRSHLERSLSLKNLYSCNDPKYTSKLYQRHIKSKEEQHILQLNALAGLIRGLKSHWTGVGWIWPKNWAKQTASVAHLWQLLQESWVELSSVFGGKNAENLCSSDSNQKFKKFFFVLFVFNVAQVDLYLV